MYFDTIAAAFATDDCTACPTEVSTMYSPAEKSSATGQLTKTLPQMTTT